MSEALLVSVLCSAIAVAALSVSAPVSLPLLGAVALLSGAAGGACMMLGQA